MSLFKDVWAWLQKEFKHITTDLDKVAITVTQQIKNAVDSPEAGFIASIIDGLTKTGIALEIIGIAKLAASKSLAIELAIQLPDGIATEQEFLDWEKSVLSAIGVHSDKSLIYTRVAATIVRDIQAFTQDGSAISFAEAVKLVEDAYQATEN